MSSKVNAKRYSQAIFEIALEKKELDRWQADLQKIAALGLDATISAVMENPKIHLQEKIKLLAKPLSDMSPLVINLVYLLVSKSRFSLMGDISEEYQRLLDYYHGIEKAKVTTAIPLTNEDTTKLNQRLSVVSGKKIVLTSEVDARVIGGIIARIGGKLIDGSTRSRLGALQKELAGTGR